jgi:peptidoglycan-associated lipoprotein
MAHARVLVGCSLLALVAVVAAGCAPKPSSAPVASPTGSGSGRNAAVTAARPTSQNLAVGDDIRRACQISVGSVEKAPKFDFDRSDLEAEDRDVLTQIARCLTTGPLKGRAVKLVGRTDSRGEPEYNMGLGEHRAGSVKGYLTQLGVEGRRVAETSRGELDASGTSEDGWRRDRRVDVLLQ